MCTADLNKVLVEGGVAQVENELLGLLEGKGGKEKERRRG